MNYLCCILADHNDAICSGCGDKFGCDFHKPKDKNLGPLLCYSYTHGSESGCWEKFVKWGGIDLLQGFSAQERIAQWRRSLTR